MMMLEKIIVTASEAKRIPSEKMGTMLMIESENISSEKRLFKFRFLKYLLLLVVIYTSGNPAFSSMLGGFATSVTYVFGFAFLCFCVTRPSHIHNATFLLLGIFIVQEIWHLFMGVPVISCIGVVVRLGLAFMTCVILNKDFFRIYIQLMVWLTALSLLMWIPYSFSLFSMELVYNYFGGGTPYTILHTFHSVNERNSGIFWEPGAFSGYLNLAIAFLLILIIQERKIKKYSFRLLLLILGVITTFSTTGYCTLLCLGSGILYILFLRKHFVLSILPMTILIGVGYYVFQQDFMYAKILHEFEVAAAQSYNWEITRYGSLLHDISLWMKHPIIGSGSNYESIETGLSELKQGMGNGFSDFLLKSGGIGMIIFLYSLCRLFIEQSGNQIGGLLLALAIIIQLQGEVYLSMPLYCCLIFLPWFIPKVGEVSKLTQSNMKSS